MLVVALKIAGLIEALSSEGPFTFFAPVNDHFLKTPIGRLRIVAMLEGISLLILIFIGLPLKYIMNIPEVVKTIGPIHGALFPLYLFLTLGVATEYSWKGIIILKVSLASLIPFGTFYADQKFLRPIHKKEGNK